MTWKHRAWPAVCGALVASVGLALLPAGTARSRDGGKVTASSSVPSSSALAVLEGAESLDRLYAVVVAHRGEEVLAKRFHGPPLETRVNVKSVSKSIVSALVGIAIAEGELDGVDATLGELMGRELRRGVKDAEQKRAITVEDLLTMRAGLERTSGPNYGRFIASNNWVRHVLTRPLLEPPGTQMRYSTGNTHLLSAILTRATRTSTHRYAVRKLGRPLGITIPPWGRDPQGIFFGGNQMRLTPRDMVRFGELYRQGGRLGDEQVVPKAWVEASLVPRTRSPYSGQLYGYGWFIGQVEGHDTFFAWGYGGQFIFVFPDLELTVVTTSDPSGRRNAPHLYGIYDHVVRPLVRHFAAR